MEYIPYKGDSEADMWLYLDELEMLNLDINAHTNIFDVMEEISRDIGGLRRLVERYSKTNSIHTICYTTAAISHFTRVATREIPPRTAILDEINRLTFKMLEDVRWLAAQPDILGGLLNTIQMLIRSGGWNKSIIPNIFGEILQRCLKFGWMQEGKAQMLQINALELLNAMCEKNIIESNFDAGQIKWLRDEAYHLATLNVESNIMTEGLREEGLKFLDCLDKYDSTSIPPEK